MKEGWTFKVKGGKSPDAQSHLYYLLLQARPRGLWEKVKMVPRWLKIILLVGGLAWGGSSAFGQDSTICNLTNETTAAGTDEIVTAQCGGGTNERLSLSELWAGHDAASSYSGVGSCTNQVVTALTDEAAPTCSSVTTAMTSFDPIEETELDSLSELNTQLGTSIADGAHTTLPTHSICFYVEDPVTDEEFLTLWRAPAAVTATEIYCEATGGTSVALDIEVDDGTATGVNGSNITCTTAGVTDSTFAGDTTFADGDRLDLDFGTVTGSVDAIAICMEYTYD
jgi:hypothetical protein